MANVTLRTRDGDGVPKSFILDTEKPAEMPYTVEQYAELKAEELSRPLHATIKKQALDLGTFREAMAAEVMRVEALSAPIGEDGKTTYDAAEQKIYYLGNDNTDPLQSNRLVMEFKKAARTQLQLQKATSGEGPDDQSKIKDPYAEAGAEAATEDKG